MKTLILNASPRKEGDSAYMAALLKKHLPGEVEILSLYHKKIAPCIDCRACRKQKGCALGEDFEFLAQKIRKADRIVIVSPIWFGSLPGPFLAAMSRLQTYFSGRVFRNEEAAFKDKKGAILLAGGSSGGSRGALDTAEILLREMGVKGEIPKGMSLDTDHISAAEDPALEKTIKKLAKALSE